MKNVPVLMLLTSTLIATPITAYSETLYVDDDPGCGGSSPCYSSVQAAVDAASDGDTVLIRNGRYIGEGSAYTDPTCGNCGDDSYRQDIPVTLGFHVSGKSLSVRGESREETVLETRSNYGVFFENAGDSTIENLTVTGGVRGGNGAATDAALVVRYTALTVRDLDLVGNDDLFDGQPDPIVGIAGIAAREGANLTVENCRIENNSWDGIALYRSDPDVAGSAARAVITNSTIGCTDDCGEQGGPRGRGAGIGVTWDARAEITNNRIHHYWKGIGSFGEARVLLYNNVVHHQLGWGVIASGESTMDAINNVIASNGTTGLAAWNAGTSGTFVNNIVTGNGWHPVEWVGKRTGVWMNAPEGFVFAYNDVWDNQSEDVCSGGVPGGAPCDPIAFDGIDGNISADPLFADSAADDYALRCGSPAIDAGSPDLNDPDGSRSDMGVYGGPHSSQMPPDCASIDLIPTAIRYDRRELFVGNTVLFDSGVRNQGNGHSGTFNVRWLVDGQDVGAYGSHAGVPANTTVLDGNSAFLWVVAAGTHTITFVVDADNHVQESSESNNRRTITVNASAAMIGNAAMGTQQAPAPPRPPPPGLRLKRRSDLTPRSGRTVSTAPGEPSAEDRPGHRYGSLVAASRMNAAVRLAP